MSEVWEPITNVDMTKRKPLEWASIYFVKLFGIIPNELWSEYEWAYNLPNLKYMPLPDRDKEGHILDTSDKSLRMELRAQELKRDLFMSADMGEKMVLQEKYIETEWVRKNLVSI